MFSVIDVHEAADGPTYVEDVHSSFTYNGIGSAQSIVNGQDLAGKGGLVVLKGRSGATDWAWYDTARGATKDLVSNSTAAETTQAQGLTSFNSDGFSLGTLAKLNTSAATYVGWTFRKAPKFFDIVTYTGNGVAGRQIAHNLGIAPGMIVVKQTNGTGQWIVYHQSRGALEAAVLNTTAAFSGAGGGFGDTTPTDASFYVGNHTWTNANGATYVAYLFAHDTSADGIIQCGTFTTDGSGNATVNLGWEPQYLLVKRTDGTSFWVTVDTARGWNLATSSDKILYPNSSSAESPTSPMGNPLSDGFRVSDGGLDTSSTFVYLAIRKGLMRPPTDASKVFDIVARTGTGAAATITTPGIKTGPDLIISKRRNGAMAHLWQDRLRGVLSQLTSDSTTPETTVSTGVTSFNMDGVSVGSLNTVNVSTGTFINYLIKEAAGFFQRVAYTGTGAARTVPHNLGAVPELIFLKVRNSASAWYVYYGDASKQLVLNTTAAAVSSATWNNTNPTMSEFSDGLRFSSSTTEIAYLFASCPGVSKIGTYTGTGAAQNIDCGFTAGARFVMTKRIDSTGNWRYADSTRGIISGNDPYLLFNSTAAEVTSVDYLAPLSTGFTVTGSDSDVNASGGTYLYWSVA